MQEKKKKDKSRDIHHMMENYKYLFFKSELF